MICQDATIAPDAGNPASWSGVSAGFSRIDPSHEVGRSFSDAEGPPPAAKLPPDDSATEQLNLQAMQLATHLRRRQEEMDHREAALNCRAARLESDRRAARLWLDQREAELTSRREELARGRREMQRRLARLAAAEDALRRRESVLEESGGNVTEAAEGDEQNARAEELLRASEELEARKTQLDAAERRLADSRAEIERLYEELAAERLAWTEQTEEFRERMDAERRGAMAEIEQQRQAVRRREEHADQSTAALKQLRAELQRTHREALEIRLATEELWARLSGAAPPAALTRSIGRLREQLAMQYAQANAEQIERKNELEAIRRELAAEHEKLTKHKHRFDRWVAGCREDCRRQASRLVARERQLHNEESRLRRQSQQWQAERLRLYLELGRMQGQVGAGEETAAR